MFFYRIPEPNQALVISGAKGRVDGAQFRIVTGHGTFVAPWRSRARILSLDLYEAELQENCVTSQGIPLTVQAVAVFKVADDFQSIANAARRFLDQQDQLQSLVGQILAGHLRSIVGGLTVEKIITDRNSLAQEVKAASSDEMEKLGLVVDAFQIQEVGDPSGYINNIAAPHMAAVQKNARIAQAQADQEATQREQEAAALKAQYVRDTTIKQAGFEAETEQAKANAAQAGPLAQASASQEVTEQQTALAERQAQLTDKRLESEVRRPADAEAYKTRTLADADRDKVKAETEAEAFRQRTLAEANRDTVKFSTEAEANRQRTMAEAGADAQKTRAAADAEAKKREADGDAYAQRTVAAAEAEAINVRADALSDGNQALIAANKLIDALPTLVGEAAKGVAGSSMTILNGTEGVNQVVAGLVSQGVSIYESLRKSVPAVSATRGDETGAAAHSKGPHRESRPAVDQGNDEARS